MKNKENIKNTVERIVLNASGKELLNLFLLAQNEPNVEITAQTTYTIKNLPKEVNTKEALTILGVKQRKFAQLLENKIVLIKFKRNNKNYFDRESLYKLMEEGLI